MRFDVITLFPELFEAPLKHGITRRAFETGAVEVQLWPLRDFADDAYRRVDDRPYGGGPGMVMLAEPLQRALAAVRAQRADAVPAPVLHFSPAGRRLDQALVREFAAGPGAVLLCGRYEGVDQRFIDAHVTHEISLGDFVLSGGELPALALLDAVARLHARRAERAVAPAGQLLRRPARRPAVQPARAVARPGRPGAGAAGAAVRPPRARSRAGGASGRWS